MEGWVSEGVRLGVDDDVAQEALGNGIGHGRFHWIVAPTANRWAHRPGPTFGKHDA
ncbi:hypothetical protein SJ05684_b60340 (plasmid) [Sinorhizobium sojae CCBAU 05684]|uniref:Uncharacterized protein n=1 Tax=Sinorhizobium sojae CCBAU 05684 TaxID=716928 RepID=A0A249PMH9_9HYPH|nr:hypothetical protein SJ05684_b60340 [Sinorhizobium sojae CCBAU 05684]